MIQCRTVSVKDSYDDTEFQKLRHVMAELFPTVHKTAEKMTFSDDCWIYKIKGKDESRNIMLMSHHDVVDATGEWQYDGFSGEIADGKIWGRGTVDTKTPLFAEFSALEELLNEGFEPLVTSGSVLLITRKSVVTEYRQPLHILRKTTLHLKLFLTKAEHLLSLLLVE